MRFGKRQLQELLYYMVLTRRLEETLVRLHRDNELTTPLGLRTGLEAISVGASFVPTPKDAIASSLPTVGTLLLRGIKPEQIVLQFLGKAVGPSRGREGLRHFGDLSRGLIATTGHAATHIGVMAGMAFSYRVQRQERVALALVPEEAVATGDFHEGVNFAAVQKCPLIVVVVRYPASSDESEVTQLYERAKGYGLAALPVDGSDLLQVVQVVETAMARAQAGDGPTLIEAVLRSSRRYYGNESAVPTPFDDSVRRDAGGGEEAKDVDNDPAWRFEKFLMQQDWLSESDRADLVARAEEAVSDALRVADGAVAAQPDQLEEGLYASP
jgi:TPP-dependent pyruvate/acetoin dehydrogenase alpha subunit